MDINFEIRNTTKGKLPLLPFEKIKNAILGKGYTLSLVFIGERRSKKLNSQYKGKNESANVLSFPLSKNEGEIFITPKAAARQASLFSRTPEKFIGYLLIHGLLHLKGFSHSSKMEQAEKLFCKRFHLL